MSTQRIIDAFDSWRARGEPMVLATVIETAGSTYTKSGHRIVIAANGDYQGLVSGGCLEGDLAEHAQQVAAGAPNKRVTYDMREEADELFGTGIGCNGAITILLQRLMPDNDYAPFMQIVAAHRAPHGGEAAVVVAGADAILGRTMVRIDHVVQDDGLGDTCAQRLRAALAGVDIEKLPQLFSVQIDGANVGVMLTRVPPLVRLLICGAGPDALPLIRMATELGWLVSVADHRDQAIANARPIAGDAICVPAGELETRVTLDDYAACVVMSHNLEADRAYLRQLAKSAIPYVGLLGPKARRDRLIGELELGGSPLDRRLRGPVGLDLGADSPEAIALSILAEIQGMVAERKHFHG